MAKLSKTAKILSVLLHLLFWVILLGSLFYGVFTARSCIALMSTENPGETFVSGVTIDYLQIYSSTGGITVDNSALIKMQLLSLVVYFVQAPLICYGIQLLRKVLHPMTDQRPFSGTGKILKKLGWTSIIVAVIDNIAKWGILYGMEHDYHLSDFFLGSTITDITFQFKPDGTFLLAAVVFFILSCVFCYGEELQQLSDETL